MSYSQQPRITNLSLRDGQQSTLGSADWVLHPRDFSKVISSSIKSGFHGAEIAGGQSFQIAINLGYNPFILLSAVSHSLKDIDFSLQMLFRGANALGFRHYDKDLVEVTLKEFIHCGITKIRFFDALNDIENLELPESIKQAEGVVLEGAICFTHYADAPERYTDDYFCRYAEALLAAGYTAIAIKDMSGQLTAERVTTLVPALLEILKPKNIPLSLHCHSTNEINSSEAIAMSIECGIDGIETCEGVLSGGSSHHSLETIAPELIQDTAAYDKLKRRMDNIWGKAPQRKDAQIPSELKERLCQAGVPGGAMPFVIRDLEQQQPTILAKYHSSHSDARISDDDFPALVDLFIAELKRVCLDAGMPLLVTPTADICCKQAIANLALGAEPYGESLAGRYLNNNGQANPDIRFAKLILGYYGELKSYDAEGTVYGAKDDVVRFFAANNPMQLKAVEEHPSLAAGGSDLKEAQNSAWQLIQQFGAKALSFASFDQLTILYALKPSGMMRSNDPILEAVEKYIVRAEAARIEGRGRTFPDYEMLMQPILAFVGPMFVMDDSLNAEDIPQFQLNLLGENLCKHIFDIYIDLPIWSKVTELRNHLSKLLSSAYISSDLLAAVEHVTASLQGLDARPNRSEKGRFNTALAEFEKITIADLFNSIALLNSFTNHVAKYATNPRVFAERGLTIQDLPPFYDLSSPHEGASAWESKIRQNMTGKKLRLEADFQERVDRWRS
ncbi:MAG: hypothetical protein ACSHX0_02135 [Akkermansiaceae bacterium]